MLEVPSLSVPWAEHYARLPWATPMGPYDLEVRLAVARGSCASAAAIFRDRYGGAENVQSLSLLGDEGQRSHWRGVMHLSTRRFAYRFRVEDEAGNACWFGADGLAATRGETSWFQYPYVGDGDLHAIPAWAVGAVFYQIFPDRFCNGDPSTDLPGTLPWGAPPTGSSFFGGDLEGIRSQLPYLADLGVQALYLTPIFQANTNHRYDTTDYYRIDPPLGTEENLRQLIDGAHNLGLRVVLDGVFNHCGAGFAPFRDAVAQGRSSPYWEWFRVHGERISLDPPNYETFANRNASMPKLLTHRVGVRRYILDVATYWTRFGIDGWRLDVANEVDHVFWRTFRETVRSVNPDALIIGEVWHDPTAFLDGSEFDTVMAYRWRRAILGFVSGRKNASAFAEEITRIRTVTPPTVEHVMMNILGSHDTERVRTHFGGDAERAMCAAGLQLTLPGMPSIYYGDEIGMEGGPEHPDARRCMEWDVTHQQVAMRERYRALIALRKQYAALSCGDMESVASGHPLVYAFRRTHPEGDILVAANLGEHPWRPREDGPIRRLDEDGDVLPPRSVGLWKVDSLVGSTTDMQR